MQSDDEAPLTLSKWPFYLGDILLVATALAIAILGKWQLTDMQVISCVLAVALGAAIFVLPFVVEYMMRVREEADDRSSEMALLKGHLQKSEAALLQFHERLKQMESGIGSEDQRYELLASDVDHKLHTGAQNLATLSQQVTMIEAFKAEQIQSSAAVKAQLEALGASVEKASAPVEALAAVQTDLAALESRLTAAVEKASAPSESLLAVQAELAAVDARLKDTVEPLASLQSRLDALEENAKSAALAKAAPKVEEPEESAPVRASRKRGIKTETGLLHRAIKEKQDSSSTAVSRIIDSKNKLVVSEPNVEPDTEPEPDVEPQAQEAAEPEAPEPETAEPEAVEAEAVEPETAEPEAVEAEAVEPEAAEPEAAEPEAVEAQELVVELDPVETSPELGEIPENFEVSLGADLIEDDELLEATEASMDTAPAESKDAADTVVVEVAEEEVSQPVTVEPKAEAKPEPESGPKAESEPEPKAEAEANVEPAESQGEGADLFGEVSTPAARRIRTKADDAILTVSILIGIGNKPFLRGSGGGLSWESGVPMDFEEIGKWSWLAPADLEEPVELQVYRNDEDADRKGRYTLNPGQKLEVSPVF